MNGTIALASLLAVVGMIMVHLFAGGLRFLDVRPRSRWLSAAGGVAVAYVFVHILPSLADEQRTVRQVTDNGLGLIDDHVYLMALVGLSVFYGLEKVATSLRDRRRQEGAEYSDNGVFWVHVGTFAFYNALIGYLLVHREQPGLGSLLFYAFAMALHFAANDHALRQHHKADYDRVGRWVLAGAVLIGWSIGLVGEVSEITLAALFSFLAGGIILNVLKEELPGEQKSSFGAFALGAGLYAGIMLVV